MKAKLTFLILLLSIQISYSQITPEWVARFDGASNSSQTAGRSAAVDDSGNVFVTGNIVFSNGEFNIITIKYNSSGVMLWVRYHAGHIHLTANPAIALDDFGNIYVGGSINDDYLIIKYDNTGNEQWVRTYNGPANDDDYIYAIAVDKFGSVFVTGGSEGNDNFETEDIVTIKYSSTGVLVWENRYDGPGSYTDMGRAIAVDTSGNVYVTGSTSFSDVPEDVVTIKYNSAGVREWVKIYNSSSEWPVDYANSIALDAEGNVIVAGVTLADYLTIKYSSGGAQLWVRTYRGPIGGSSAAAVAVDNSGNIYVTGSSRGSEITSDYATIKYNPEGVEQWVRRYNGTSNSADGSTSIGVDFMGNLYVTGYSMELNDNVSSLDYTTIKYDTDGNQKWLHSYNGTGNGDDRAFSLAVDDLGSVYVTGSSKGISTTDIVTIKYPKGSDVYKPSLNEKWIAGETDTIKWIETGWLTVNIKCITNFETPIEGEIILAEGYPTVNSEFEWEIPDTLLSYKSKIIIENANNTSDKIESDIFRIKPFVLTRLNEDSTYSEYRKNRDQWGFSNTLNNMWPPQWWLQFDYNGVDPFTGSQYSRWQANSIFVDANSALLPDWISWVNTFSVDACYFSTFLGIYKSAAVLKWKSQGKQWRGSCFGIAVANALAFRYKEEFQNKYPNFPDFLNPITVASDTGVKRVVNELFTHQFGNPHLTIRRNIGLNKTPKETLIEMIEMFKEDNAQIRTLSFVSNDTTKPGGHAILAYGLDRDPVNQSVFYIKVYDNSYPDSSNRITIDTSANNNNGSWVNPSWPGWGGNKWFYLRNPTIEYFTAPTIAKSNSQQSPFILEQSELQIIHKDKGSISVKDELGNITGFYNNILLLGIPGSVPLIVDNPVEDPPYGYSLPTDNYSVVLNQFEEDTVNTFFFTGNKSFMYERSGAILSQTDRIFFDGGVSVANPDAQSKRVKLLNLINETTQEKLFVVRTLDLTQNDSVKIENPDSNKVKLISYGAAKNYGVELNYVTENGIGRFGEFDVSLAANTSHTFIPDWSDITNTDLMVLVDNGNNGTIDDTLYLQNQVTGIGNDQGSLLSPNSYNLAQNYPNPFNPTTTIQYSIPERSSVTLKIYDVLGNELAILVDEEKTAGSYEVNFNASQLASGIYFYKLQAGNFIDTKKMLLMK